MKDSGKVDLGEFGRPFGSMSFHVALSRGNYKALARDDNVCKLVSFRAKYQNDMHVDSIPRTVSAHVWDCFVYKIVEIVVETPWFSVLFTVAQRMSELYCAFLAPHVICLACWFLGNRMQGLPKSFCRLIEMSSQPNCLGLNLGSPLGAASCKVAARPSIPAE